MSQSFKNVKKIFEIKEVRLLMKSPKQKRLVKVNLMKMIKLKSNGRNSQIVIKIFRGQEPGKNQGKNILNNLLSNLSSKK